MTDRATLLALADRVEAADGPDRELDVEIFRAIGHEVEWRPVNYIMELRPIINWKAPHVYAGMKEPCPEPTASLDAALSLVPEGAGVEVHRYWTAEHDDAVWSAAVIWGMGSVEQSLDRPSAALALCAAALRALAQEAPGDE